MQPKDETKAAPPPTATRHRVASRRVSSRRRRARRPRAASRTRARIRDGVQAVRHARARRVRRRRRARRVAVARRRARIHHLCARRVRGERDARDARRDGSEPRVPVLNPGTRQGGIRGRERVSRRGIVARSKAHAEHLGDLGRERFTSRDG